MTEIAAKPHMPPAAVARLEKAFATATCYLEYGSGGSTVLANELQVPTTVSVESDKEWLQKLKSQISSTPEKERVFIHADIGPTGAWGNPVDDTHWRAWHHYPLAGWKECGSRALSPDLVLIDGRFRAACFYATLIFARTGSIILFDDYGDRPFYHEVERSVRPSAMHDRMAEFVVPSIEDKTPLWLAFADAVPDKR